MIHILKDVDYSELELRMIAYHIYREYQMSNRIPPVRTKVTTPEATKLRSDQLKPGMFVRPYGKGTINPQAIFYVVKQDYDKVNLVLFNDPIDRGIRRDPFMYDSDVCFIQMEPVGEFKFQEM